MRLRPHVPARAALALALLMPAAALHAQRAVVRGGDVFLEAPGAPPRRLTDAGLASQAALSPDGRWVAFVRATPGDSVAAGAGRAEAGSLWRVPAAGGTPRLLLRGGPGGGPEGTLAALRNLRFAPDGGEVYFLSAAWATSDAVHALDPETGRRRFVAPGNSLEVVPAGRHAGSLLVSQHRYFLAGGSYDWVWLLRPDGREVGPVGETTGAVQAFLEAEAAGAAAP